MLWNENALEVLVQQKVSNDGQNKKKIQLIDKNNASLRSIFCH